MSTPPTKAQFVAINDWGEWQTYGQALIGAVLEGPGGSAQEALTIAGGVVTPTVAAIQVDTEAAAASDDLDTIAQTNHPAGRILLVRSTDAARVVVLKHATGNLQLRDDQDVRLETPDDFVVFLRVAANWVEIARSLQNRLETVKDFTNGSGSPLTLYASDSGKVLTNRGAVAEAYANLPTAVAGQRFLAVVVAAQALRLVAGAGDTIRDGATVSAAAGYASMAGVAGNYFEVVCLNATEWVVVRKLGTLTVA
ncbi:MAG: hypothetical protein HUU06_01375 [Planctomycetaceae bacterium]|nr:hypothetical protein [Planctomycetaceae bacterium]